MGQHDLEHVAGGHVLLGRPHRVLVQRVGHGPAHVRREVPVRSGNSLAGWSRGRKQSAANRSRRVEGIAVGEVQLVGSPSRVDDHVVDEHHPLTPVVEGGQLPDHGQDGIRMAVVVGRGVRQVLHLPDHVVAQVADQPGMERRQLGKVRGVESVENGLERGQHPPVRR